MHTEIYYVVKTGNRFRTTYFGYTLNLCRAHMYRSPPMILLYSKEKVVRVEMTCREIGV